MSNNRNFKFYQPSRRSWIVIVSIVIMIHLFGISWTFYFNPSTTHFAMMQRPQKRLVAQTIDLSPSSPKNTNIAFSSGPLLPHPIEPHPLNPAHMGKAIQVQKTPEKTAPKTTSSSSNPINQPSVTEEKTFSNTLPSNPIQKKSLTPAALNQNTTSPETTQKKSPTPSSQASTKPSSKNSPSSSKEKDIKANSGPLSSKSQASKPTSKSKKDPDNLIAAKEVKKKKELTEAIKQEADQRNQDEEIEKQRQMKLVAEAQERMSKINKTTQNTSSSPSPSSATSTLPTITSLQIDALPSSRNGAPPLNSREVSYRDELASHLKLKLRLPEIGDIKIKLTLDRTGKVYKIEVVSSESSANRRYIEKTIPGLSFPAFGTNFDSSPEYTFAINLSNEL